MLRFSVVFSKPYCLYEYMEIVQETINGFRQINEFASAPSVPVPTHPNSHDVCYGTSCAATLSVTELRLQLVQNGKKTVASSEDLMDATPAVLMR